MGVIGGLMIFWLILCCISFLNDEKYIRKICSIDRCPESLWIVLFPYRGPWRTVDEPDIGRYLGPKDFDYAYMDEGELELNGDFLENVTESVLPREADTYYFFRSDLIGAIIVFLIIFAWFAYSFVFVWSYSVELKSKKVSN